jgi:acyl dehydratase
MAMDQSFIGRSYPPTEPYEVGREKIREFADAIGDPNPAYRDRAAAEKLGYPDVIAPPTFPIAVAMRATGRVVLDPQLGLDYSRVVHGEQRFVYSRPVRAGDRLTVAVTIENIRSAGGNDLITTRGDISTVDGEHVVTTYYTLVARGAAAPAQEG